VRDDDGLALSSRNAYLTPNERAVAPTLYHALLAGKDKAVAGADAVRRAMRATVAEHPEIALDYAEVADPADLTPLATIEPEHDARLLIAARIGRTRLIDNLGIRG
jgi:pantoate--beta-alanine ligase